MPRVGRPPRGGCSNGAGLDIAPPVSGLLNQAAAVGHEPQRRRPRRASRPAATARGSGPACRSTCLTCLAASVRACRHYPFRYRRLHVRLPDQTLVRWYASSIV